MKIEHEMHEQKVQEIKVPMKVFSQNTVSQTLPNLKLVLCSPITSCVIVGRFGWLCLIKVDTHIKIF